MHFSGAAVYYINKRDLIPTTTTPRPSPQHQCPKREFTAAHCILAHLKMHPIEMHHCVFVFLCVRAHVMSYLL